MKNYDFAIFCKLQELRIILLQKFCVGKNIHFPLIGGLWEFCCTKCWLVGVLSIFTEVRLDKII